MSVDGPLPEDAPLPADPPEAAPRAEGFEELRAGNLGLRVAETAAEIDAAQALRFRVFYEEMGARADPATLAAHRDADEFDAVADQLRGLRRGLQRQCGRSLGQTASRRQEGLDARPVPVRNQ